MNILIIGNGMYVCGKGTSGLGTLLPALMQACGDGLVQTISVAATSAESIAILQEKVQQIHKRLGLNIPVTGYPEAGRDATCYQSLLRSKKFDAAIVSVPDHLHYEVTSECLNAGCHTLVVKPFTPTINEAQCLIGLARKNHVYGAVEFHKRWDQSNLKAQDMIRSHHLGDLLYINVNYSQRKMIPTEVFKGWSAQTSIFQYLGVHYADLIHFLTGAKPLRTMATGQKHWLLQQGIDTYDAIQSVTEWLPASGKTFVSTILCNWIDPDSTTAMSDQKISIVGTKGRMDCDQKNRGVQIVTDACGVEDFNPYFSQFYPSANGHYRFEGYGEASVRQFVEDVYALKAGRAKPADFEQTRPSLQRRVGHNLTDHITVVGNSKINRSFSSIGKGTNVFKRCLELCC